jgi:O-antigen/teichoic acid export membrane protein
MHQDKFDKYDRLGVFIMSSCLVGAATFAVGWLILSLFNPNAALYYYVLGAVAFSIPVFGTGIVMSATTTQETQGGRYAAKPRTKRYRRS